MGLRGRKELQHLQLGDEEEEETHVKRLPTTIQHEETNKILCLCEGRKDMWLLVSVSTPGPPLQRGAALMLTRDRVQATIPGWPQAFQKYSLTSANQASTMPSSLTKGLPRKIPGRKLLV